MGRPITTARYAALVEAARARIPDVAVTTDVMVGFPGEDEAAFAESLAFVERMGFARRHVFPYSPRPGTPAARLPDDVPPAVKQQRNRELLAVQAEVSLALNREQIGRTVTVLVEGPSRRDPRRLTGRTPGDHIVCFPGPADLVGREVPVRITEVTPLTLLGELVSEAAHGTAAAGPARPEREEVSR